MFASIPLHKPHAKTDLDGVLVVPLGVPPQRALQEVRAEEGLLRVVVPNVVMVDGVDGGGYMYTHTYIYIYYIYSMFKPLSVYPLGLLVQVRDDLEAPLRPVFIFFQRKSHQCHCYYSAPQPTTHTCVSSTFCRITKNNPPPHPILSQINPHRLGS